MKNKLLLLIVVLLSLVPKINYGQAPVLGVSAGFVLFTSVGAVTNVGISQVTGNVGSNVGASTNFGNVNGIMQSQNLATAACSTAVLGAYNQLAATTATFFPSPSLGGDTLIPGVYSVAGASTLNNTLTLNAQGNPNAVFIFKLQGSFSAAANAKVKLINGALACNVFWKIEGLTSLATNVTMRGTIITNNAAISMSAGDTLEGRAFSTAGAISVNGVMAYTPIGCGSPFLTGPMAPTLGTTANYALFSSIGPVTNTGVTNIIGDVGTNSGLTTGFNPLLVNGTIHPIPDISTIQCSTDLVVVYNYLNSLSADIELLYPAQFGNNLVLTPHTYLLNAATTLTDTLFLNGQGNPNAVFVIKIFGALSTSTYSNVVLTNGTKSRNVYWLVNGAVSINDYSIFRGTIIANNGAISFAIGSLLDGRALTTVGAVNVNAMTVNAPNAPFVITPPTAKLVCLGDTARFIVSASGTNLTYQWRRGNVNLVNGLNISGVTNDTLTIFPVTYADTASNYNVIISGNVNPNDTTLGVALKINSPIIITEPISKTVCLGSNVNFSVTTSGTGITYQWRKGNTNLINGGNIQGATSDSLKINGVTLSDVAANYNVVISGVCSPRDTSNNAALNISTTVINAEPVNQTSCLGNAASFIVRATGSGLTYQWRKGNVNLVNSANITGATNDTLRILVPTFADTASNYNVIVSGICSTSDTSINVSLFFNSSIVVLANPINQSACLGSSARFITRATGSGLTYQWRRGNVNLVNGLNITGVTTDTLRFNATTIADTATNYNVIISSICSAKDTSNNVSLNINLPLAININPSNQTVCLGSSARFITRATGSGLTYQWRRGNVNLVNGLNITGVTTDTLRFNATTIADTATNYNVIISSICSAKDTSNNVSLNINLPLAININPSNQTVCLGSSARFVTRATGSGLTYQWRRGNVNLVNGLNITGVTTDTLRFNATTILDTATNYNVIISSICSARDTSSNVSLNINLPLAININPSNQTVCLGSSARFITRATGSGLTYQWRRGNVNLVNGANISGVTTDTLRFNATTNLDTATNYNVIISSICSAKDTSANVSLNINLPLAININPSNQTVCLGSSARFVTRATGSGLTYQWRRGNVNLVNGLNISGVTTDTLRFNATTIADTATNYNVIISSICSAKDTSNNVSLNINLPLAININPSNQTVCLGSSARFVTRATGSGLTYQWRRGNVNLVNGLNITGVTTDTLRFNATTIADTATNYNVIISSICSAKDTSANVSLNINLPLAININPSNQTVCLGSSARFETRATGSGLTYQWRRGNVNLVNGANISGVTTDTLRFNATTILDTATNYNVIITSICSARDTSLNVSLNIITAPIITTEPTNQIACAGSSVSFLTAVSGNGLNYQWRKDGIDLVNGVNISGANSNVLNINQVALSDTSLNYYLVVTNTCGITDSSVRVSLKVNSIPLAVATSNSPICEGKSINLSAQTVTGGTYAWSGPNGFNSNSQNPIIISSLLADSGNYTLVVTQNGCNSILANLNVIVRTCVDIAFSIPEGFSPNGDGVNDLFVIKGIENYPALSVSFYNRWGNLVFEAGPYQNNWNGKSNSGVTVGGDDLPIGTYFYIIDLGNGSPIVKGTIYLNK